MIFRLENELMPMLKNAKKIVCMDANMTKRDLDWISRHRTKDIKVFYNEFVPRVFNLIVVDNEVLVIKDAIKNLKEGKIIKKSGG